RHATVPGRAGRSSDCRSRNLCPQFVRQRFRRGNRRPGRREAVSSAKGMSTAPGHSGKTAGGPVRKTFRHRKDPAMTTTIPGAVARIRRLRAATAALAAVLLLLAGQAFANDSLKDILSDSNQWGMANGNYQGWNYSELD